MVTTLLIVRHGISVTNKEKRYTGHRDVPLAPLGYAQGRAVSRYLLENYKIDAVYASDLCRAVETIRPLADALSLPVNQRRGLREIFLGDWEGKTYEEVKALYPETYAMLKTARYLARYEGGESYAEAYERVKTAFLSIARENEGKTVAICSHGGAIRIFLALVLGLPFEAGNEGVPPVCNASLTAVEIEGENMRLLFGGEESYLAGLTEEVNGELH